MIPTPNRQYPTVVHLLSTAQFGGSAQAKMVIALAGDRASAGYRLEAWILGGPGPLVAPLEAAGISCRFLNSHGGFDPLATLRLARALRVSRPEVIHMHLGGRSRIQVIRHLSDARIIAHLHGTHAEDGQAIDFGPLVEAADAVIATSFGVGKAVTPRAEVISPGVSVSDEPASRSPNRPIIGALSRLEPVKRLDDLVEAGGLLQRDDADFLIEIAGTGSEWRRLRDASVAAGLESRIAFLGWRTDLDDLFSRWSVFASTSAHEGFGLSVLEAMAAGLPVVATATYGSRDLVEHGRTGFLVPVGDADLVARRIGLLLRNQELRNSMGVAGRRRAKEFFSPRIMAERTFSLYDRLIRTPRP